MISGARIRKITWPMKQRGDLPGFCHLALIQRHTCAGYSSVEGQMTRCCAAAKSWASVLWWCWCYTGRMCHLSTSIAKPILYCVCLEGTLNTLSFSSAPLSPSHWRTTQTCRATEPMFSDSGSSTNLPSQYTSDLQSRENVLVQVPLPTHFESLMIMLR